MYSKETTNLGLPIYEPDDIISYLTDWNPAMEKIDEAVTANKDSATNLEASVESAKEAATEATTASAENTKAVAALDARVTTLEQAGGEIPDLTELEEKLQTTTCTANSALNQAVTAVNGVNALDERVTALEEGGGGTVDPGLSNRVTTLENSVEELSGKVDAVEEQYAVYKTVTLTPTENAKQAGIQPIVLNVIAAPTGSIFNCQNNSTYVSKGYIAANVSSETSPTWTCPGNPLNLTTGKTGACNMSVFKQVEYDATNWTIPSRRDAFFYKYLPNSDTTAVWLLISNQLKNFATDSVLFYGFQGGSAI